MTKMFRKYLNYQDKTITKGPLKIKEFMKITCSIQLISKFVAYVVVNMGPN